MSRVVFGLCTLFVKIGAPSLAPFRFIIVFPGGMISSCRFPFLSEPPIERKPYIMLDGFS